MPAAIPIAAAVIGAVGSNMAANKQAKAANAATDNSREQAQLDREQQLKLYEQQRADQAPYREAGYGALSNIQAGFKPGGDFNRDFSMADYQADPGYQFRVSEGENAINRAATAAGSRYSGATLKALSRFNSDQASQEYGNAYNRFQNNVSGRYNRLASLAGLGQTATNQTQQAGTNAYGNIMTSGMNATNAINSSLQNAAAARASGYVGTSNLIGNGLQQLAANYQQQQYLNQYQTPTSGGFNDLNANATNQTSNFDTYGPGYSP